MGTQESFQPFTIVVSGTEYTVVPSLSGNIVQYTIPVHNQDVVFQPNEYGEIQAIEEAEPVELLQLVAKAIEQHFL